MSKWNCDWKAVCKDVENSEMIFKSFKTDQSNEGPSEQDVTRDESFFSCTNDQTITNISMEDPFESFVVDADETMETDYKTETCKEKDANGKDQLISECTFGVINFPKKPSKKFDKFLP